MFTFSNLRLSKIVRIISIFLILFSFLSTSESFIFNTKFSCKNPHAEFHVETIPALLSLFLIEDC